MIFLPLSGFSYLLYPWKVSNGEAKSPHCKQSVSWRLPHEAECVQSMGWDNMHLGVLKELANVVAKTLNIISEKSLLSGEVPSGWKNEKHSYF